MILDHKIEQMRRFCLHARVSRFAEYGLVEIAQQGCQAIPTLLYFKGGQLVEQTVGVQPEKEIRARLDGLLK